MKCIAELIATSIYCSEQIQFETLFNSCINGTSMVLILSATNSTGTFSSIATVLRNTATQFPVLLIIITDYCR